MHEAYFERKKKKMAKVESVGDRFGCPVSSEPGCFALLPLHSISFSVVAAVVCG